MAPKKVPSPNVIQFPSAAPPPPKKKRKKGQRADGRFCARVTVVQDGKKKQIPFYSYESLADAQAKAREFKAQLGGGLSVKDRDITVAEWGERWIQANEKDKSYGRRKNYRTAKNFVDKRIGERPIRSVTELELRSVVGDLDGFSKSHIDKNTWYLQTIFQSAYRNHIISSDPAQYLTKPQGTYEGHRCLEEWEIALILNHWRARRAGIWMMAMLFCGIRRSESFAARLDSFNHEQNEWTVEYSAHIEHNRTVDSNKRRGKTDAALRTIKICEPLRSALIEDFQQHPRTYFMENADGQRITGSGYCRSWKQMLIYLEKAANGYDPESPIPRKEKIPENWIKVHFTAHDLRDTFATFLYDANVDEKTAQLWMGHESPEMTRDLYAKLTARRKARSDASLGEYLNRFTGEGKGEGEKP